MQNNRRAQTRQFQNDRRASFVKTRNANLVYTEPTETSAGGWRLVVISEGLDPIGMSVSLNLILRQLGEKKILPEVQYEKADGSVVHIKDGEFIAAPKAPGKAKRAPKEGAEE